MTVATREKSIKKAMYFNGSSYKKRWDLLDQLNVDGIHSLLSSLRLESYFVILADLINKTAFMNKNVFVRIYWFNKAKTFGRIKKLYNSFFHSLIVYWLVYVA